jgi:hypothetical protein
MNSIDGKALRALTDPLFDALTDGAASRQAPFPLGPDPKLASYYTQRPHSAMGHADFLSASCLGAAEFAQCLEGYWRAAGHPELAARAMLVAETARGLHALHLAAQPQAEVSPYIYQMF